ncbi:nucleolin [Fistulifera solaris]|uniref:Nucleolin n=1 Tax=Fistulifera solaris TaxID=1519565 RepID=A0A1Z5KPY6_FISSO|nr:nucleolin [Fistulifera solaris]|eukprot:GAX28346.1 nucleolin [Fistulifera solaris]
MPEQDESKKWENAVLSITQSEAIKVKKLRKQVLITLQMDEDDKAAKKIFKETVQRLEETGQISLDSEGNVTLTEKSKKRKSKEEKKSKKNKKTKTTESDEGVEDQTSEFDTSAEAKDKNKPCPGNPQGVTRLFLGNLPFAVDEALLGEFFKNKVTHIKWITDKETGKFYGSAFIEMSDSRAAAEAVALAGEKMLGRPVKINFAPARDGDVWPPEKKVITGGPTASTGNSGDGNKQKREMSEKPENCVKLFIGNLSYDIDDEGITKFFANVDAEVRSVRWLHHKDSGDFKGCGYVEFWSPEACDKAATLNGKNLLGRPIRIDWTD